MLVVQRAGWGGLQNMGGMGMRQGGASGGGMGHGHGMAGGGGGGAGGAGAAGLGGDGMMGASMTAVHTGVIRMRGLPFSATKQDVINFFQGEKKNSAVVRSSVVIRSKMVGIRQESGRKRWDIGNNSVRQKAVGIQ